MRLRFAVPLVLAAAAACVTPAHAYPPTFMYTCGLHASQDPTGAFANPGTYTGTIDAGPIVTATPGTVVCNVQVGGSGFYYDADAVTVSMTGAGVFSLPPTEVSFDAFATDPVWLCTTWQDGTGTYYYDTTTGDWFTNSSFAACDLAISTDDPPTVNVNNQAVGGPVAPPAVPVQCNDGVDNDGDGRVDYPNDPDCTDTLDNSEAPADPSCTTVVVVVCASYTTGTDVQRLYVVPTATGQQVAAYEDTYRFTLPNGGVVSLPCVVLVTGATTTNPCASAGGTFVKRDLTLVNQPGPNPAGGSVGVCNATLRLTVNGFGIESFPAYAIC